MAFLQVAVLTLGTFLSVILHFGDLPGLIETMKRSLDVTTSYRTLLGSHLSHLLWIVYAVSIWDPDFAIPNILLAVITLVYLWIIHMMARTQAKASLKYALAIPIVLLILWRAIPSWAIGALAGVVGLSTCLPAVKRIEEVYHNQQISQRDVAKLSVYCLRNLSWVALGVLKHDYCIVLSFTAQVLITSSDLTLSLLIPGAAKQVAKAS